MQQHLSTFQLISQFLEVVFGSIRRFCLPFVQEVHNVGVLFAPHYWSHRMHQWPKAPSSLCIWQAISTISPRCGPHLNSPLSLLDWIMAKHCVWQGNILNSILFCVFHFCALSSIWCMITAILCSVLKNQPELDMVSIFQKLPCLRGVWDTSERTVIERAIKGHLLWMTINSWPISENNGCFHMGFACGGLEEYV